MITRRATLGELIHEAAAGQLDELRVIGVEIARQAERINGLDRLTDAKFVTFRTLIDSQAEKVALALDAADKAVNKAEASINERLAAMNEFRATLADLTATFIPRVEAEQRIAAVLERLESLRDMITKSEDKLDERIKILERGASNLQGRMWALGAVIGAVVLVVNVAVAVAIALFSRQ